METPVGNRSEADLRVVFFTAAYHIPDGVALTVNRIARYLQKRGAQTLIITADPKDRSATYPIGGGEIVKVSSISLPFATTFKYCMGLKLDDHVKKRILDFKPTVMHFSVPDLVARQGLRWAEDQGIPSMATWHSNYADYLEYYGRDWFKPILELYLRGFYKQIQTYVPTPYISSKLQEIGFNPSIIGVWGRGVDIEVFSPSKRCESFRSRLGFDPTDIVILWAGRTVYEKRPDIYGNIIKKLIAEGLPVKGLVAGGIGPGVDFMNHRSITHLGWLNAEDLAQAYASSDILLFPSAVETFGNVTLESLSCGTPAVVEKGCSGHLVTHGLNGYVCEKDNEEQFYEMTRKIVVDRLLLSSMKSESRRSALDWEMDAVMSRMADNYRKAAEAHKNGTAPKATSAIWIWSLVVSTTIFLMSTCDFLTKYVPGVSTMASSVALISTYVFNSVPGLRKTRKAQQNNGIPDTTETEGISSEAPSSRPPTPTS
eukprot:TRINITY_DN2611_c0_g1_i1.p1 TRINITY_DN2611_c0_g1~~TRINITY_DN2611_c0_g1_i1.p1  ORF type:complete len:485 (+),score=60.43 TRINITY_DN2611_c0_g1_i1:688-2142(+)